MMVAGVHHLFLLLRKLRSRAWLGRGLPSRSLFSMVVSSGGSRGRTFFGRPTSRFGGFIRTLKRTATLRLSLSASIPSITPALGGGLRNAISSTAHRLKESLR